LKPKGNQQARKPFGLRRDVYKCVESLGYDPKPGDLGVGRLKRGESCVEDRSGTDVQIVRVTCV